LPIRVCLDPAPADRDLIDSMLDGDARQASVTFDDGVFLVPRRTPWQQLDAQLAVSAVLAIQPDYFIFHSAPAAIAERGVLLTGQSGSGKTSVSLALAARGHGFLSDEIGALHLPTGTLVPVRRSALVRQRGLAAHLCVPVAREYPAAQAREVPLTHVIHLRQFAPVTCLERVPLNPAHLNMFTPLASSLNGAGVASRVTRLFRHLGEARGYALDAASPEEAADVIARVVGS
jgi:hypothetical protein